MTIETLREVEVNGHQEFWVGRFHGWGIGQNEFVSTPGLQTMAIVEHSNGSVSLVSPQKIWFKDTKDKWLKP